MRLSRPLSLVACAAALALVGGPAVTSAGAQPAAKPGGAGSTGTAAVFMVNPVQSSGDQSLSDQDDAAGAVPASAYATVQLRNLDGSGYLRGAWAVVDSATGTPAYSTTNTFRYDRHQDQFEQVMAYFWVNQAQEYLQSLGFGSTFPGILKAAVLGQGRPVRRRQQLRDLQAVPDPARQGRGR